MGLWSWFGGSGRSGFGTWSTAEEVTEGIDATHLTAIVTGGTSGIGRETARVLALRGAEVIIPGRNIESALRVKESLLKENPSAKLQAMEMDVSSISSVISFARAFNSSNRPLNILVNNAGIMACPFQLSKDGIELQFATNHLGHFLLTNLLLDKLKSTAKLTGVEGRIVNVSSIAHRYADSSAMDFHKLNDPSKYKPYDAYARSKLANILHANELAKRLQDEGSNVTANSLHPGVIPTNISRHMNYRAIPFSLLKPFLKNVPQGASTTCYVALHPDMEGVSGKYFANCNQTTPSNQARDLNLGKKLWELSQDILEKLKQPK
ncbi:short-chain dehydrogenase TIC 32 A, chloroplastic-like isoform X2 [Aristolochia californica]|uniref:short-chain dehydrogenase TIC 32 A, chloroplastic-like isoform X2 n=1 Tax=Aristolochia californica TaxID=171875 RepID=UPI0035D9DC85